VISFKQHHVKPILSGEKTATRRKWKKCRVRVGSVHQCKTGALFTKDYFARIRILKAYRERLGDMRRTDYRKEGGYTKKSFIEVWKQINGSYNPNERVWVVEFELIEEVNLA